MTTEQNGISRRSFLTTASGLALGVGVAQLPRVAQAADALPPLPWPYPKEPLDPAAVAKAAYALYYSEGGCGQGSAQALIDAIGDALADEGVALADNPWKLLPRFVYRYGAGGVVAWGTICGALNGSIAVMGLLTDYYTPKAVRVDSQLGNSLVDYFCNTALPTDVLVGWDPQVDGWPDAVTDPLPNCTPSVSHSPLCHNTVSNWAATAAEPLFGPSSAPKSDHCAKLVADIVRKAVELLNDHFLYGNTPATWQPPASYATCYNCHTKPGFIPSQQGKMECQACHTVEGGHGSWKRNRGSTR